jgi:hypothetical protein
MRVVCVCVFVFVLSLSCAPEHAADDSSTVIFEIRGRGENGWAPFYVALSDPATIAKARAQLSLPETHRNQFVNGTIKAGNGGVNAPWSWHLTQVDLVEMAVEVCDGTPMFVEANVDYWVNSVTRYCPWSSYVYAEISR